MLGSLFPLIYGALFVALLWQAFRVMSKGFRAASGPINSALSKASTTAQARSPSTQNFWTARDGSRKRPC